MTRHVLTTRYSGRQSIVIIIAALFLFFGVLSNTVNVAGRSAIINQFTARPTLTTTTSPALLSGGIRDAWSSFNRFYKTYKDEWWFWILTTIFSAVLLYLLGLIALVSYSRMGGAISN